MKKKLLIKFHLPNLNNKKWQINLKIKYYKNEKNFDNIHFVNILF